MTVLIDPPAWPAHGTVFSHLVSDASLEELHAFARAAGLSERAFDRDHYDVPAHRRAELVARGAVPVTGRELVRRLAASGLRVPARSRAEKRDVVLARRWARLFEGTAASPDAVTTAGRDLLARWAEPHRHYHDPAHLLAVLESVDLLERAGAETGPDPRAVRLAAWFHDAVYAGDPTAPAGQDEADSAALARDVLTDPRLAVPADVVDEVARLGFMTSLARARDAGRKYGITLVMIYQSEGQLLEQWGDDGKAAWFESVTWRSYSAIADITQAKSISEACGEHGVVTTSQADGKGVSRRQPLQLGTRSKNESATRSEQRRRLITADEIVQDMRTDEQIVFVRGRKLLRCGRAIYFRRADLLGQVESSRFA